MAKPSGKFVWYELMTNDTEAAEKFYTGVVGWTTEPSGMTPEHERYTLWKAAGHGVGGMLKTPEEARSMGAPPNWAGYVWVEDVDTKVEELKAAGGSVYRPPEDIPEVGRFAVVADPHGAAFVLFRHSGDQERPPIGRHELGNVGWHELHAGNGEEAFAFYSKLFGWTKAYDMDMGPMGIYRLIATGDDIGNSREDQAVGAIMTKNNAIPKPFWLYYFNVPAIDAAIERLKDGGGQVVHGPMEVPGGHWVVQAIDPEGVFFALVAPRR